MMRTSHSRFGTAALLVVGSALLFAASAAAQDANLKCRQTINKAFAKHIATVVKAYQKCNDGFVKAGDGENAPGLDQLSMCSAADEQTAVSESKMAQQIVKKCDDAGIVPGDIDWPSPCPNFEGISPCIYGNPIADGSGVAQCLATCIGLPAARQALDLYYKSLANPGSNGALIKCQRAVGKETAKFFTTKQKILGKCRSAVDKGKGTLPCPIPGDGKAAASIAKAEANKVRKICKACGSESPDGISCPSGGAFTPAQIGFAGTCPAVTVPFGGAACSHAITNLDDLITCVDCVTEFKVDCLDALSRPDQVGYPAECLVPVATPTPTVTPTSTAPTATPTPIPGNCGNGVINPGEDCDPAGGPATSCQTVSNTSAAFTCSGTCECACPTAMTLSPLTDPANALDIGWTGITHRLESIGNGDLSVALSCGATSRPCGTCTVSGPVANPNAGAGQLDSQRCTNNPSIHCTTNTPCFGGCLGGPNDGTACTIDSQCPGGECLGPGACQFFFGAPLSISAGGLSICWVNQLNGPVSGTVNVETGDAATTVNLTASVYNGIAIDTPCVRCVGDANLNDGMLGGTCSGGTRNGLTCDGNGTVANRPDFGTTSLDCPPIPANIVATLPIDLSNATAPVTKTLDANSPICRGATGRCLCDTCNNVNAEPCDANGDCPDPLGPTGPLCGGRRCLGGTNHGAPCSTTSECSGSGGGVCSRPGEPPKPSGCLDDTATPTLDCLDGGNGEGTCTMGPQDGHCSAHPQRYCLSDANCGSCVGGSNANASCTVASQCPGGTCTIPAGGCVSENRKCFLTGVFTAASCLGGANDGFLGCTVASQCPGGFCSGDVGTNTLTAIGMADTPMGDTASPTLGAVFCVAPTSSSAVNAVSGLPGPGRTTIKGAASFHP